MEQDTRIPKLAASTSSPVSFQTATQPPQSPRDDPYPRTLLQEDTNNYFKSLLWTPDGTCMITNSADHTLRTYVAPPDLLTNPESQDLTPYTTLPSPEPVYALAPYPYFTHADPVTTLLLSSVRDHPIRLWNTHIPHDYTGGSPIVSTYPLINPTTEAYLTPASLLWLPNGTHFLTGTDSLIASFDTSRNGEGPITRLPTIPSKRHKLKGGGVGIRGIVSSLSLQPSGDDTNSSLLAAGTWTRWLGLYDADGQGGTVATWSIASAADNEASVGGSGVAQTLWSSCGRYLFVAERKSRGVLVYDVRVTGKMLQWLVGREAETNQRLGVDIFPGGEEGGSEIWAGGTDGTVKVWRRAGLSEGPVEAEWIWRAHGVGMAVSGVGIHYSGTVLATCSGQRRVEGVESDDDEEEVKGFGRDHLPSSRNSTRQGQEIIDNSVKLWNLL